MAKKHLENIIGKIIYGTLLFMPLLNVLGTSIYAIANKNAYESYYGENEQNTSFEKIDSFQDLQEGKTYRFDSSNVNTYNDTTNKRIYIKNVNILFTNANNTEIQNLLNCEAITTTYYDSMAYVIPIIEGATQSGINMYNRTLSFTFEYVSEMHPLNQSYNQCYDNLISIKEYNQYYYLDNAFEYGIYKTENSPYYNWTTETAINDVIHQTTTTLGINNSFVDLLLTYWLLMTIIYVIYDLGLMLIQIAHKKVHKICDKD